MATIPATRLGVELTDPAFVKSSKVINARWPSLNVELLVEELAAGLRRPSEVWNEHGIVMKEDAALILSTPAVKNLLAEARARWNSVSNMRERVKAKAMMAVESQILTLHREVGNAAQPLNHRIEGFKTLARIAELDSAPAGVVGGGGSGVSITIDLGAGNVMRVATGGAGGEQVEGELVDEAVGDEDEDEDEYEDDDDTLDICPEDYLLGPA